ncbi:MAG: membrane protein [Lysobacteraceae bacterium]|nr:MAG: membrane protein [Xanthomonadaceae bacterium]
MDDLELILMNNLALYVVTVLVWGSTWLLINFQLGVVPVSVSLVYRYALAAALLFIWCQIRSLNLRFSATHHARFAAMGALMFGINYMCTYSAQQYISSSLNAVAFSAMLWMNILNARMFFGTRSDWSVLIGAVLGMVGVVVLFLPAIESFTFSDTVLLGASLCLAGAYSASLGNMVSQNAQTIKLPVMQSNAWGMAYGVVFLVAFALIRGDEFTFDPSFAYLGSLLYLSIFGSIVAFGTYLTLLGRIGAARAGYAVVMFPAVAVILSLMFEGLELTPRLAIGIALTLAGNVVILWRKNQQPTRRGGKDTSNGVVVRARA